MSGREVGNGKMLEIRNTKETEFMEIEKYVDGQR